MMLDGDWRGQRRRRAAAAGGGGGVDGFLFVGAGAEQQRGRQGGKFQRAGKFHHGNGSPEKVKAAAGWCKMLTEGETYKAQKEPKF